MRTLMLGMRTLMLGMRTLMLGMRTLIPDTRTFLQARTLSGVGVRAPAATARLTAGGVVLSRQITALL